MYSAMRISVVSIFHSLDRDEDARSLLHYACEASASCAIVLVENKADVNLEDAQGHSPLYHAVLHFQRHDKTASRLVDLLLEKKAGPNQGLQAAATANHIDMARKMIAAGASVNAVRRTKVVCHLTCVSICGVRWIRRASRLCCGPWGKRSTRNPDWTSCVCSWTRRPTPRI